MQIPENERVFTVLKKSKKQSISMIFLVKSIFVKQRIKVEKHKGYRLIF
jgi:hypothetical protein